MKTTTPEALAAEFSRILHRDLTPEQIAEANALNAAETVPYVCHTHDFCDANVAMAEAFQTLTGVTVMDQPMDDEQLTLWETAWTRAKNDRFMMLAP